MEETRECNYCHLQKPLSDFRTNLTTQCKACKKAYMRSYFLNNKKLFYAAEKRQKTKDYYPEMRQNILMKYKYGVNLEQYNKILEEQNHCCALCGRHESEFKKRLHIDHDHQTGNFRGLLCHHCNTGLGHFDDNIEVLLKAIEYLKKEGISIEETNYSKRLYKKKEKVKDDTTC